MFHIAKEDEIKKGYTTDIYFERTLKILKAKHIDKYVKAEFVAKEFPLNWQWAVLCGIDECAKLLRSIGKVKAYSMPEGTIFGTNQPVLTIEGRYRDFCIYETALLGFLCHASGITTKSARYKKAAGSRLILSFGARRIHPAITPMLDRSAYIGGCDGVSCVKSAKSLGLKPSGTIPHALVLLVGDVVEAAEAFNEIISKDVPRMVLVDTFGDEKFEALRVADKLGKSLTGVRLDTPSSRRGNFKSLLEEVRWELDLRGFGHVKLVVSGGIDEEKICQLNSVADAYGIGTAISNAPVIDFSMDIIEIDGQPIAKRGKPSGEKSVFRCPVCFNTKIIPKGTKPTQNCKCGKRYQNLISPLVDKRKFTRELPAPSKIRDFVLRQLEYFNLT